MRENAPPEEDGVARGNGKKAREEETREKHLA
jgi:hypothetical protein